MWKRKRLKQSGGTCGYFALANAINHCNPSSKRLSYNHVEKLIKSTIEKGYSHIGEIFHYDDFESIIKEFKSINKEIDFDHNLIDFNKELVNTLTENQAILVNHCAFPQVRRGLFSNSHWVTIVKARQARFRAKKNNIKIINSAKIKIKNIDEVHATVKNLRDKKFDWTEFLNSKAFKKHYLRNRILKRRFNRYFSEIGLDFKEKMNETQYKNKHAIIEHDHSKALLLTF